MNKLKKIKEDLKTLTKKVEELEKQEPEYFRVIERGLEYLDFGFIYKDEEIIKKAGGLPSDFFEPFEKPQNEEEYWYIQANGMKDYTTWENDEADNFRWKTGNVFPDEESAERHYKRLIS